MTKKSVFEEKNIPLAVVRLALPAMLGTITTLIYNMADTFFVSMTREPAMIAAVTLCAPILLIIMSISSIFGMGGSSVIARLLGEDRKDTAARSMNYSIYSMVFAGVLVAVLGMLFMKQSAGLSGADEVNMQYTMDYLKWVYLGAPFIMMSNGFVHLTRSVGLIKESTVGMMIGNIVNIVLDYVFIVMLGWGTAGAAAATSLGFTCSSLYFLLIMISEMRNGNSVMDLNPAHYSLDRSISKSVISIGIPGAMITVLMSISNIVLNNYIGIYGSDAVASYGIAFKLEMIPILMSVGLSQGVAPLVGFYYGGAKHHEMREVMKYGTLYGIVMGFFFVAVYMLFSVKLVSVFLADEVLIQQAAYFTRVLVISAPMLAVINMGTSYFQALGKAMKSMSITLMRNAILFIPGVILLNMFFRLNGVVFAQPVVETILCIVCAVMYLIDAKHTA